MRQLNPGTLETKQCRLAHTQAEFDDADHDEISTLGPVRYQGGTNPFAGSLSFYHIQIHQHTVRLETGATGTLFDNLFSPTAKTLVQIIY